VLVSFHLFKELLAFTANEDFMIHDNCRDNCRQMRGPLQRILISLFCVLGVLALFPKVASAHPMGNFSTNRYSRVNVGAETIELLYIVDMAEIPTHAERTAMDTDGDKVISPLEEDRYLSGMAATLPAQLVLALNGEEVRWTLTGNTLRFVPGQADLPTLRMEFVLHAPLPVSGDVQHCTMKIRTMRGD
jgi:hypothetical protein